jgi:hypothetical protein
LLITNHCFNNQALLVHEVLISHACARAHTNNFSLIFLLSWNLVSKCNLSKRLDFNLLALLWSSIYLCWRYLPASLLHFLLNTIRETRELWTKIEGLEKGLDEGKKFSPFGNSKEFFFSSNFFLIWVGVRLKKREGLLLIF